MKLSELKPCAVCGGRITPNWYVVRITQAMLSPSATRSTMGLAEHFGGLSNPGALAIAETMSPDSDCVLIFGDKEPALMTEVNICSQCFLMKDYSLAMLMESTRSNDRD